jgi:hypothetical protein
LSRKTSTVSPALHADQFLLAQFSRANLRDLGQRRGSARQLTQRGIPMLVEALVRLRALGATFLEVPCEMTPRATGVASASRFKIMWRTLRGLFQFWWQWRSARPAPPAPHA